MTRTTDKIQRRSGLTGLSLENVDVYCKGKYVDDAVLSLKLFIDSISLSQNGGISISAARELDILSLALIISEAFRRANPYMIYVLCIRVHKKSIHGITHNGIMQEPRARASRHDCQIQRYNRRQSTHYRY